MYNQKIAYPRSDKYKILDEYVKNNDVIKISELPPFTNRLKSLHSACIRLNTCLVKRNDYVYEKVDGKYTKKDYIYKFRRIKTSGRKRENFCLDIGY